MGAKAQEKGPKLPSLESPGLSVEWNGEELLFHYDLDAIPPKFPVDSYVTYNTEGKKISDSILKIIKQPRRVTEVHPPKLILNTRKRRRSHNQFSFSAELDPVNKRQGVIKHKTNPKIKDDFIVSAYIEYSYATENESTRLPEGQHERALVTATPPQRGAPPESLPQVSF